MAEAIQETVRARRFEVVDEEGRVRVVLGLLGEGEGPTYGVSVRDEYGRAHVDVAVDGATSEVSLWHHGDAPAVLSVAYDGYPALTLDD